MRVKLRRSWFYPVDAKPVNDRRDISGGRLRKGIHEIDNALRDYLPKDAEILDEAQGDDPVLTVDPGESLSMYDDQRAEGLALDKLAEDYNEQVAKEEAERQERIKKQRAENLRKAREAKKAKAEAKSKEKAE